MRLPRLPDLLTTANLSCGVASILLASQGQLTAACALVFVGALFDVLDGLAARALGGGSEFGKQLDSLADMVTFGVAPAFAIWWAFASPTIPAWIVPVLGHIDLPNDPARPWLVGSAAVVLTIASAWRLAEFNVDDRQTSGFLGLPTPANALFWSSIVQSQFGKADEALLGRWPMDYPFWSLANPFTLLTVALLMAGLMLSELPLPSLKFKHFKWKGNEVIYLLLGIGAVLVLLYGTLAVPLILIVYLLSPLWGRIFPKPTEN